MSSTILFPLQTTVHFTFCTCSYFNLQPFMPPAHAYHGRVSSSSYPVQKLEKGTVCAPTITALIQLGCSSHTTVSLGSFKKEYTQSVSANILASYTVPFIIKSSNFQVRAYATQRKLRKFGDLDFKIHIH